MGEDEIIAKIVEGIPDAEVTLEDLTGGSDHWRAVVVADAFEGIPLVRRHRMVYQALGAAMHGPIHALALETFTREERAAG
ncbi:MAG: BolA family transcriptional regulator [Myxococcota bacterium]|nr:BolA family transcriptional regulator [Myxococcota bacterium]